MSFSLSLEIAVSVDVINSLKSAAIVPLALVSITNSPRAAAAESAWLAARAVVVMSPLVLSITPASVASVSSSNKIPEFTAPRVTARVSLVPSPT